MSVTLVRDCPHCGVRNSGFQYLSVRGPNRDMKVVVAFTCNGCQEILAISGRGVHDTSWMARENGDFDTMASAYNLSIREVYPDPPRITAPQYVSSAVVRSFLQAEEAAQRNHRDASASMYRKAMDVATRELDDSLAGKNLAGRIDALHSSGKLTTDLKEWAHLIRLDGNQGAHDDEELTTDELTQLASFTRLFLTYTFTLPKQVELRKQEAGAAADSPPDSA